MIAVFPALSADDLRQIASAIRSRRLLAPFTDVALSRIISPACAPDAVNELQQLAQRGFDGEALATLVEVLSSERALRQPAEDVIDLVTTGPESGAAANRDTSVVVRELFAGAERYIVVAGYAVYQGQSVFRALAKRMAERPGLRVRMFLDVQRGPGDTSDSREIIERFGIRFVREQWPVGERLPELFYYSRSLDAKPGRRAALHAKCVVVDEQIAFVSSANFTEAAQERNIEVGVLVRSPSLAQRLASHFEHLVIQNELLPLALIRTS